MTPEEISDAKAILSGVILHAVNLQKYSNGQVRRILAILNRADGDIFAELQRVLDSMPSGTATSEYLFDMLASVRRLNAQAYAQIEGELTTNLQGLAEAEANFQLRLYQSHAPEGVTLAGVTAEQAWAAAYSRPFTGKLLKESMAELGETRARRVRDAVRMGFVEGRTTSQIVRDIRGTRAKGYVEGFVEVDRRHLETMVRTAVQHTAGGVRDRFMEENSDVLESQLFVATLDGRTSPFCIARSGKRYTLGERPKPIGHAVPWCTQFGCGPGRLHYNCRSTAVGLLPGQTKLYGTRASANGPVDANMTYGQWLKSQPAAIQDQVLGEKRAELFRSGGLPIEKFFNDKGQFLSLDQLRERDAASFRRAGVERGQFRQPRGDFTVYDSAYPKVKPDVSTPAKVSAVRLEEQIRRDSLETGAFIAADGRVIIQKTGQPDRLRFSGRELQGTDGTVFTHNHPNNGTFSSQDIKAAIQSQLAEVRAVGPTLRHSMRPGAEWPTTEALTAQIEVQQSAAIGRVERMIAVGELEPRFATAELNHQLWSLVARELGMSYTRERS